jgi:hypothetical protein
MSALTIANCLVLLANIGVFGLSLKLYTEILKDQSQNRRAAAKDRA